MNEKSIQNCRDIVRRIGEDVFLEHVAPHLAFQPTPCARIMQEAITSAIIVQVAVMLYLSDEDDDNMDEYPADWDQIPNYSMQRLEAFIESDLIIYDVLHLVESDTLLDAVDTCIMTHKHREQDTAEHTRRRLGVSIEFV